MSRNRDSKSRLWKAAIVLVVIGGLGYSAYQHSYDYITQERLDNYEYLRDAIIDSDFDVYDLNDNCGVFIVPLFGDKECYTFYTTVDNDEYLIEFVEYSSIHSAWVQRCNALRFNRKMGWTHINTVSYRSLVIGISPPNRSILRDLRKLVRAADN